MTDIVERLRYGKELKTPLDVHLLLGDAAYEIERLREALREIEDTVPFKGESGHADVVVLAKGLLAIKATARAALREGKE